MGVEFIYVLRRAQPSFPFLHSLDASSSVGSVDVVEVFIETRVFSYHVEDCSAALHVLNVIAVELANDREFIKSNS